MKKNLLFLVACIAAMLCSCDSVDPNHLQKDLSELYSEEMLWDQLCGDWYYIKTFETLDEAYDFIEPDSDYCAYYKYIRPNLSAQPFEFVPYGDTYCEFFNLGGRKIYVTDANTSEILPPLGSIDDGIVTIKKHSSMFKVSIDGFHKWAFYVSDINDKFLFIRYKGIDVKSMCKVYERGDDRSKLSASLLEVREHFVAKNWILTRAEHTNLGDGHVYVEDYTETFEAFKCYPACTNSENSKYPCARFNIEKGIYKNNEYHITSKYDINAVPLYYGIVKGDVYLSTSDMLFGEYEKSQLFTYHIDEMTDDMMIISEKRLMENEQIEEIRYTIHAIEL